MAVQRGGASNVGLLAREAAQQGAATQQQAVGQGATLEAEQQLNALGQQAGIAGQQVGELQTGLNTATLMPSGLTNQQQLLGAQGQYNTSVTGGQGSVNTANTPTNLGAQNETYGLVNGGLGGAGTAFVKGSAPQTPTATPASQPGIPSSQDWANVTGAPSAKYQGGEIHGRDKNGEGRPPFLCCSVSPWAGDAPDGFWR